MKGKKSFVQKQRHINSKRPSYREGRREDERDEKHQRRMAFNSLPEEKKAEILRNSQIVQSIQRNGITIKDLEKNFELGRDAGFREAAPNIVKTCYAAICLALHELYGFGKKRCHDVLTNVDQKVLYSLTSAEAIEEVWEKVGLQINFEEPFGRIVESEEEHT